MKSKIFGVPIIILSASIATAEIEPYGQINRGFLFTRDGHEKNLFFVDSSYDNSNVGIKLENIVNKELKFGSQFELWVMPAASTGPKGVTQLDRNGTINNLKLAVADFWVASNLAKFSLGYGAMASKNAAMCTLADADLISYAGAADMAGSIYLHPAGEARRVQANDPDSADPQIMAMFNPISGLGRQKRLRYDFPKFGNFMVSTSIGKPENSGSNKYCKDLAITYSTFMQRLKLQIAMAISKDRLAGTGNKVMLYSGSVAVLDMPAGLNAALAAGLQTKVREVVTNDNKRTFYYAQIGKQAVLNSYGKTNFAVDFWQAQHSVINNDKARACSIGVVQKVDKLNTELYFGIRNYQYVTPSQKHDRVIGALLGAKIKF